MDEDIFIPLIFFTFVFLTIRMILAHNREKTARKLEAHSRTSEGGSLRTSELKALIREAVEEANEPLMERVEALEARLGDAPRLLTDGEALLEPMQVEEPASARLARKEQIR